jgi:LmbE family N-acetylglucosaminyl deacetylase
MGAEALFLRRQSIMADSRVALAVGAHPDDVEFMMAGTLALLADAGYQCHIFTIATGNCGTATHTAEEIVRIRAEEARASAAIIGAVYHEGLVNDMEVVYEVELLRRVTAVIREVRPEIVLTQSPEDYMEDHQNASRLTVSACFVRGVPNWASLPPLDPTMRDVSLYHANPYGNRDGMRNLIRPSLFVDVGNKIELKEKMLRCHASQKEWLDVSQGADSYLTSMREMCREIGSLARDRVPYAEGWRQHLHVGLSAEDRDTLSEVLTERVQRR